LIIKDKKIMEDDTTLNLSDFDINDLLTIDVDSTVHTYDYSGVDTITIGDPNDYDLTINRPGKPPMRVADTLEKIMERLSIIEPDFDKMDRYPALREAYDNYKLIEAMLTGNEPNGNS
jgi:hypothetical protein